MIYLGIDPGLNGGIAFIEPDKLVLHKTPVIAGKDYDIQSMKNMIWLYKAVEADLFCTIETQISMPGQGLTSTLQTGKGFGIWLGLLAALESPYQVIGARQWQSKLFTGVSAKLDTKARSEIIAKRLFPTADFRKSERAFKADDGLTDAACIAEYGRRTHDTAQIGTGVPHIPLSSTPSICGRCGKYIPGDSDGCFTNN